MRTLLVKSFSARTDENPWDSVTLQRANSCAVDGYYCQGTSITRQEQSYKIHNIADSNKTNMMLTPKKKFQWVSRTPIHKSPPQFIGPRYDIGENNPNPRSTMASLLRIPGEVFVPGMPGEDNGAWLVHLGRCMDHDRNSVYNSSESELEPDDIEMGTGKSDDESEYLLYNAVKQVKDDDLYLWVDEDGSMDSDGCFPVADYDDMIVCDQGTVHDQTDSDQKGIAFEATCGKENIEGDAAAFASDDGGNTTHVMSDNAAAKDGHECDDYRESEDGWETDDEICPHCNISPCAAEELMSRWLEHARERYYSKDRGFHTMERKDRKIKKYVKNIYHDFVYENHHNNRASKDGLTCKCVCIEREIAFVLPTCCDHCGFLPCLKHRSGLNAATLLVTKRSEFGMIDGTDLSKAIINQCQKQWNHEWASNQMFYSENEFNKRERQKNRGKTPDEGNPLLDVAWTREDLFKNRRAPRCVERFAWQFFVEDQRKQRNDSDNEEGTSEDENGH